MAESATGRLVLARLKLVEDLLKALEGSPGLSLTEWRESAQEARRSKRGSELRRAFRRRVRATKRAWRVVRDLIERNGGVLTEMERATVPYVRTLRHGPPWKCYRPKETGAFLSDLIAPKACWILCSGCVESARTVGLAVHEKQRALLPSKDVEAAIAGHGGAKAKDGRLYRKNGRLREGPYRILCALDSPRAKLEAVAAAARFKKTEAVRAFTSAMQAEGWIDQTLDRGWVRTKLGDEIRSGSGKY